MMKTIAMSKIQAISSMVMRRQMPWLRLHFSDMSHMENIDTPICAAQMQLVHALAANYFVVILECTCRMLTHLSTLLKRKWRTP